MEQHNDETTSAPSLPCPPPPAKGSVPHAQAGGSAERCCVCCRPAAAPYRAFVDGVLTYGCIDATHGAHVSGADLEWHDRPAAEQLRRGWLAHELTF